MLNKIFGKKKVYSWEEYKNKVDWLDFFEWQQRCRK